MIDRACRRAEIALRWPGAVVQSYLPYDLPYTRSRRFLRAFRGAWHVLETEAWTNLVAIAEERRIPMVLVMLGYRRTHTASRAATHR